MNTEDATTLWCCFLIKKKKKLMEIAIQGEV